MKRSHRVLVVDDDPAVAAMVVSLLTGSGYMALAETNGAAAINAVENLQPHLVLLDLRMPDWDGATVARRLRERGRDVPLVAMSALSDVDRLIGESNIDVASILAKPFDISELLTIIKNVIHGTYAAAKLARKASTPGRSDKTSDVPFSQCPGPPRHAGFRGPLS